jgi:hypothetical protein
VSVEQFDAMRVETAGRVAIDAESAIVADADGESPTGVEPDMRSDLVPPFEQQFAGKDFLPAPGLRRMALLLISRDQSLRHLTNQRVEFLWKRRGGASRGQPKIGDAVLPSGLTKHAWNAMARAVTGSSTEHVTAVVWLAADHLETYTPTQVEASLYRQLLKITTDPRDHSAFKLRAPDFGGFIAELNRYGLWNQSLQQAGPAFRAARSAQPDLFDPETAGTGDAGTGDADVDF